MNTAFQIEQKYLSISKENELYQDSWSGNVKIKFISFSIRKNILKSASEIYIHMFIFYFVQNNYRAMSISCCHVMALCHEDKQILYFQCKHACFAVVMKFKYYNVYKLSKQECIKNNNYIMQKHYKQEHLSSSHVTSMTSNGFQNMIECNSTNIIHLVLIYLQTTISLTNSIILIVHQINCIFSICSIFSWWCPWHSMARNDWHWQF